MLSLENGLCGFSVVLHDFVRFHLSNQAKLSKRSRFQAF